MGHELVHADAELAGDESVRGDQRAAERLPAHGQAVRLALREMVRAAVVHRVRPLPGEVRHEEEGVQDVADEILKHRVVAEGAVAALVRDDPAPGRDRAVRERVQRPQRGVREAKRDRQVRRRADEAS